MTAIHEDGNALETLGNVSRSGVIWPADPAALLLLTWLLSLSVASAFGPGLIVRAISTTVGLLAFTAVYSMGYSRLAQPQLFMLGSGTVALLAAFGPPGRWTATGMLGLAGIVVASLAPCPVEWVGLLHHVGLVGISAHTAASCYLLATHDLNHPRWSASDSNYAYLAQSTKHWSRRTGWLLILLTSMVTVVLIREPIPLSLPNGLGIWLLLSECLAGTVAWRVLHHMRNRLVSQEPWRWNDRVGLLVAGMGATIGLMVVPFAMSAANPLP